MIGVLTGDSALQGNVFSRATNGSIIVRFMDMHALTATAQDKAWYVVKLSRFYHHFYCAML